MVMGSSGSLNISSRLMVRKMYYSKPPLAQQEKANIYIYIIIIPQDDQSQGGHLNWIVFALDLCEKGGA